MKGELLEVRAEFDPGTATQIEFTLRGISVVYDVKQQEIIVNGHLAPAPLIQGKQRLQMFIDRTTIEVFASDGLTYMPLPVIPKAVDRSASLAVKGGKATFSKLEAYELKSIWEK